MLRKNNILAEISLLFEVGVFMCVKIPVVLNIMFCLSASSLSVALTNSGAIFVKHWKDWFYRQKQN